VARAKYRHKSRLLAMFRVLNDVIGQDGKSMYNPHIHSTGTRKLKNEEKL